MQKQKWNKFEKLTGMCYSNMIGAEKDGGCWIRAFALLKELILEERKEKPDFAPQLEIMDDAMDYEYDIQGWLEDCLDELDMRGEYESVLNICEDLFELFEWPDYTGSDLKFRKSAVLGSLGRKEEAAKYCEEWIRKEPENIVAAVAGVYALIDVEKYALAEELVAEFIPDKSVCSDENDMMFTAASKLYEAMGKRTEKKQIDQAIKKYDAYLEQYFKDMDMAEDEIEFWDDDLPF